jgi:hypothetical protein
MPAIRHKITDTMMPKGSNKVEKRSSSNAAQCAKLFNLADARDDSARKHLHDLASSLSRRLRWDYRNFAFLYQSYSIASASTGVVYSPAEIPCQHANTSQQ